MLLLFQILFVLFVVFALSSVIRRQREGVLGRTGMWFWILFWLAAAFVVLWPSSTQLVAQYLGIGRGADLVVYVSLALVFYLLFKLHIKIEAVGRDITKVVRREALAKVGKES